MTITENVEQALKRANATDPNIQSYAEQEVISWLDNNLRTHRWDFARQTASTTITQGTAYISLASDYYKIHSVKITDSNGNSYPVRVVDISEFDDLSEPTKEGRPYICAVMGSNLYFYFVPDNTYTVTYLYWRTMTDITADTDVPSEIGYSDQIIQRVAFIAARQYDGLDYSQEYALLQKDLAEYRRNSADEGRDGAEVKIDMNTHIPRPVNFF